MIGTQANDDKTDGDCKLCVVSFGGCGTTAIHKHLAPYRNTTLTEYDECTRYHSHRDPFSIVLPEDVTIIYLFCDPINAFLSLMRRHVSSIFHAATFFHAHDDENNPRVVDAQQYLQFHALGYFENHCINLQCSQHQLAVWRSLEGQAVEEALWEAQRRVKIIENKSLGYLDFFPPFIDAILLRMSRDPFGFHGHMQTWLEASREGTLGPRRPVIFVDSRSLFDPHIRNSLAVMAQCPAISTFEFRQRVSNHSNFGAIARFRMERVYGEAAALVKSLPSVSYFH